MPKIFEPQDLPLLRQTGASLTTLGTSAMLGTAALQVERIRLEANAAMLASGTANAERFLYVIRGGGQARVGTEEFPLAAESVLWIEAEDSYIVQSGPEGLEVLVCRAPAAS